MKIREILRLICTTKLKDREIARSLDISHNTSRRYRAFVKDESRSWGELSLLSDDELDAAFNKASGRLITKRHPDWSWVHQQMQIPGMPLTLVWEEYREQQPKDALPEDALGYSQFSHLYRVHLRALHPSMRQVHLPGERTFMDFSGKKATYINAGVPVEAELFIAALGYSDRLFAKAYPSQELRFWIQANVDTFEAFGGVTQILVPDNLKAAITKARRGPDYTVNRTYHEMVSYYGSTVIPARSRRPKDKAKVEGSVLIAQRWILLRLRNRTFFSLEELNRAIAECVDEINRRPFKKLPGSRLERFEATEKAALLPLPAQRYELGEWTAQQTVPSDYHICVAKSWYSVPFSYIGRKVEGRASTNTVEIYCSSIRVATHTRVAEGGTRTDLSHMPKEHHAYAERTPEHFLAWARQIGPATTLIVQRVLDRPHPALGLPNCDRLKQLERMHGAADLESAAQRAVEIHSLSEKTVRTLLANNRHRKARKKNTEPEEQLSSHENIRGKDYFA